MDWNMITAIATAVSTLAVVVSVFILFPQLRRLRLSQEVTVVLTLYDRSTTPEMLEASLWLKTMMPAEFSYAEFQQNSEARQKLERLWYYFEFLGVLVNRGYVSEDIIFDQQGAFIAGVWDKSQNLIKERRQDRNSPQYMENFEILENRFEKWATKYPPKITPDKMRKIREYYRTECQISSS